MRRADRLTSTTAQERTRYRAVDWRMRAVSVGFALGGLGLMGCATPTLSDQQELIKTDPRRQARFEDGPPRRVVLVTVAGLQPGDYLDPFGHAAADGALVHMPTLARLAREGVTALAAMAPIPGATRTSHATLVTGVRPSRHGIVADSTLDGDGTRSLPFLDHRSLEATTLWDAAVARGVVSLGWPTTGAARIERLLPEPSEAAEGDWLARVRPGASPGVWRLLAEHAEAARAALGQAPGEEKRLPSSWPSPAEQDGALVEVACRLLASDRDAGLWLLRLSQSRPLFHGAGPGSVEVDDALARADAELERLVGCLEATGKLQDTAIFVAGDVAYEPVHTTVSPNVALVRAGLIGRDPRAATGVRSWLALARSQGRTAYVYARDAANAVDARGVLEAEAKRTQAFDVVSAQVLGANGADPQAWFGLEARPGFSIGNDLVGSALRGSLVRGAPGGLAREISVGFVAWGRGVRNGVRIPRLELIDVAPTIAALLGLRLDDDVEGEPIVGLLRSSVEPPPPGPKRLGGDRALDDRLRDLRGGRRLGAEPKDAR